MTEMFLIWAYLTINSLLKLAILVFLLLTAIWGIVALATNLPVDGEEEDKYKHLSEKADKYLPKFAKILIVVIICKMVIPNKTEVGYIIGGAAVFNLASSSEAQKLPENVLKAANKFLEGMDEDQK